MCIAPDVIAAARRRHALFSQNSKLGAGRTRTSEECRCSKGAAMQGEIVAEQLAFPEGPVWHEGQLYFVEIGAGRVSRFTPGRGVERFAQTGGGPNGATLGRDGNLYVTQN